MKRSPGISVLLATQNEEATIAASIRSFLAFGDEIVVVDNGSTDNTIDIIKSLVTAHADKVKFYHEPKLPDLYHNRQFALERSRFQWLLRGDSDYICYTSGPWNIANLRAYLKQGSRWLPPAVAVPQVNASVDLWHTGQPRKPGGMDANLDRWYLPPPSSTHMVRFYRFLPGFRFERRGRWEATRYHKMYGVLAKRWPHPVWMHCTIKPDMHHFYRSERTNWRQMGDFERFPTLSSYVKHIVEEKYGTTDLDEAARLYMERHVYPFLIPYDDAKYGPYPELVREMMVTNPIFRLHETPNGKVRCQTKVALPLEAKTQQANA